LQVSAATATARTFAGLAVVLALASGFAAPAAAPTGYSEVQVAPARWRVGFTGQTVTAREPAEAYLLYRAAELTVRQGADWFEIVDPHAGRDTDPYVRPDPRYTPWRAYGGWRPQWRYYLARSGGWRTWDPWRGDPFWGSVVDPQSVERFEVAAEILMGRGAKPANDPRGFDARAVIADLRPRIR
jgi:hypothetical protein